MSYHTLSLHRFVYFCEYCKRACHVRGSIVTSCGDREIHCDYLNDKPKECKYCGYNIHFPTWEIYGQPFKRHVYINDHEKEELRARLIQKYERFLNQFNDRSIVFDDNIGDD